MLFEWPQRRCGVLEMMEVVLAEFMMRGFGRNKDRNQNLTANWTTDDT